MLINAKILRPLRGFVALRARQRFQALLAKGNGVAGRLQAHTAAVKDLPFVDIHRPRLGCASAASPHVDLGGFLRVQTNLTPQQYSIEVPDLVLGSAGAWPCLDGPTVLSGLTCSQASANVTADDATRCHHQRRCCSRRRALCRACSRLSDHWRDRRCRGARRNRCGGCRAIVEGRFTAEPALNVAAVSQTAQAAIEAPWVPFEGRVRHVVPLAGAIHAAGRHARMVSCSSATAASATAASDPQVWQDLSLDEAFQASLEGHRARLAVQAQGVQEVSRVAAREIAGRPVDHLEGQVVRHSEVLGSLGV
mmetsp:Transcript_104304/g.334512  ORF Transcript_104304/g.334512 Transcript_104304/m.334512 type:complete len:308 (+) Transcript_104304:141-1064(+)